MNITVRNIDNFSDKEIIDFAEQKILEQGKPSVKVEDRDVLCQYRSPDGCKCVAGYFIPDEDYGPGLEGKPIDTALQWLQIPVSFDKTELLYSLQKAHDRAAIKTEVLILTEPTTVTPDEEFIERFRQHIATLRRHRGVE